MNANDPAYPDTITMGPNGEICRPESYGLTKRELIAAMVLQGICSNASLIDGADDIKPGHWPDYLAKNSLSLADALILELSKDQPK